MKLGCSADTHISNIVVRLEHQCVLHGETYLSWNNNPRVKLGLSVPITCPRP